MKKIFSAKNIITMNPDQAAASHVVIDDGKITAVGGAELVDQFAGYQHDTRFQNKILMPGLIEGHSHTLEGLYWEHAYVGFYDRVGPDGTLYKGLKSIAEVVAYLQEHEAQDSDRQKAYLAWGFDPIHFAGRRMLKQDLDQVSTTRSVVVMHASSHVLNCNSRVLELAEISSSTQIEGVVKDDAGQATGELRELAAMFAAFESAEVDLFEDSCKPDSLWNFARIAQIGGVTTATDLYNPLSEDNMHNLLNTTADNDYPIRLVPAFAGPTASPEAGIDYIKKLIPKSTDKLHIGCIKLMTDGSIQGYTARLKSGKYYNGAPNGVWNAPPEELATAVAAYHKAGLQMHIHANGDEASEVMLDAIEAALNESPDDDHRHTLQHCQLMQEDQLQRAADNGVCINMFANHIYYWGEAHYTQTVGPERAETMEAFNTANKLGVNFAMHSDAPITHMAPIFTAWCAVNRLTASGRTLGEEEKISVHQALKAVTLGAAYTLKLDHLIGSIEPGKFADFTVLGEDPYQVDALHLKNIEICGTVLGGKPFEI